jgi:ribonuclease HI
MGMPIAQPSCILEFDGASKGNPGPAGAGAVLRAEDGSMVGTFELNKSKYRGVLALNSCVNSGRLFGANISPRAALLF